MGINLGVYEGFVGELEVWQRVDKRFGREILSVYKLAVEEGQGSQGCVCVWH